MVPATDVMGLQITAASPDDRAGPAGGGWHRARLPLLTRRGLQVALGILWLLDGGRQFQPFIFSRGFLTQVIEPAAAGQPRTVVVSIPGAAHLMSRRLGLYYSGAATIQILIGVGLLFLRTVKPALLASFGWALGVWAFGEGFGLLPTGQASLLTGAPGAVLIYVLAGMLIWPAGARPMGAWRLRGCWTTSAPALMWANLWLGFAALSMLPANITSSGVGGIFQTGGSIAPGPLPAAVRSRQATKQKGVTRSRLPRWCSSAGSGMGRIDESRHHRRPRRSHQRIGPCPRSLGERNSDAKKTLPGHAGSLASRGGTNPLWACSRGTSDR